jgi:tetratricopeptide (TPR) repeat protein
VGSAGLQRLEWHPGSAAAPDAAGDHDAEYYLGVLLEDLGRLEEAEAWYRRAADAGH